MRGAFASALAVILLIASMRVCISEEPADGSPLDDPDAVWPMDETEEGAAEEEGIVKEALITIHPGFSPKGNRASIKHDNGQKDGQVECSISYSALGGQDEEWKMVIRETEWQWSCWLIAPKDTGLTFSFYSLIFAGGGKGLPVLEDVEVWGKSGVLVREEHYVIPQGLSVRNAAGWTSGLNRILVSRRKPE